MLICFGKGATRLKEQEGALEIMISLLSSDLMGIYQAIHSGFKSRQEHKHILSAVDENGKPHRYRLTISLDSLAGSEKNDAGMNKMATAK